MTTRRLAVATALLAVLAGCTGDGSVDESPSASPIDATSPSPPAPASPSPTPSPSPSLTPSPTPSPSPSPSPTVDTSPGSLANPLAIGDPLEFDSWTVVVEEFIGNATEAVVEANSVNPEPTNAQYARVTLAVTNTGDRAAEPGFALTTVLIGGDQAEYPDTACAALPDEPLMLAPELEPGDEATGSFCFDIPADALDGGLLSVEETLALDAPRLHVALG